MITPILFEKTFPEGIFRVYDGDPHQQNILFAKQTHSNIVLNIMAPDLSMQVGDGVCGTWPELRGQVLAVKTADCLPVLIIGEHGAAMVHAGWRGLAEKILTAPAVRGLAPKLAFVGPCIHAECFEVTAEFKDHFPHSTFITKADGTLRFDLVAEARTQLRDAFPELAFEDSGVCTFCESKYSSFRRDKTTRRIWNCFAAKAN